MRFKIALQKTNQGRLLPINYQYELSSAIYKVIERSDMDFSDSSMKKGIERGIRSCRTNKENVTFETFFQHASLNPNTNLITEVICVYCMEEIEDTLTQQVRYLDKLVDELAKGKKMGKILLG